MRPFEYEKATDVPHALTLLAERPNARFLGGGHQPRRPGPARGRDARQPRRRDRAPAERGRGDAGRRAPGRRGRDERRPGPPPAGPDAVPPALAGRPGRGVRPAPHDGHRRRQPAAAHPLRVLHRPHGGLQQARARLRLRRARRVLPVCGGAGNQRPLRRGAPQRHGRRPRGPRRPGRAHLVDRRSRGRRHRPLPAAGRDAEPRDRPLGRRAGHRRRPPAASGRRLAVPQGSRPGLVRVRARLGRGGPRRRGRQDHQRPPGPRGGRPEAVARRRRGVAALRRGADGRGRSPPRSRPSWPTRNRCPATSSSSASPDEPWSPCCAGSATRR